MSDGDLFREVDEDLRREQYKAIWDKYGLIIIGVAVAIVVGVSGYKFWQYWQAKVAGEAGAEFSKAINLIEAGKANEGQALLDSIRKSSSKGYQAIATLRLAATKASAGENSQAVALYDQMVKAGQGDQILRDFAQIQAATLRLDVAGLDEIKTRLTGLTQASSPWRHSARELIGLSAYKAGKSEEAQKYYREIVADRLSPTEMKRRAEMMLTLLTELNNKPAAAAKSESKTDNKATPKK